MSRTLSDPRYGLISDAILPIEYGGTGASTPEQAAINLDMIPTSQLGQPNGVAKSDAQAKLPLELLMDYVDNVVMIDGPTTVSGSIQTSYSITNYDYQKTYHLSVIGLGSVVQDDNDGSIIKYTPPPSATVDGDGFIINGKKYFFTISPNGVNQPTIIAPVNNAEAVTTDYQFVGSAFGYSGASQTHLSSNWQVATDVDFQNIVLQVADNGSVKTTWSAVGMDAGTRLYVRVRYKGSVTSYSNWSNPVGFTTKDVYPSIETASVVSPDSTISLFGYSTAMTRDGTTVVMTSPNLLESGVSLGAFYVFKKIGESWIQQYKGKSPYTYDTYYGASASINDAGDTIIIGSPWDRKTSGTVGLAGQAYIYKKTGDNWALEATIKGDAYDAETSEDFGCSVSLDSTGNIGIIGARLGNTNKGYAYIFRRSGSTWTQEAKIQPAIATVEFGKVVSISADGIYTLITGAATKAYVFKYATGSWTEQAILTSDVVGVQGYGVSASINDTGDVVIIGANGTTITQDLQGGAYIFTRNVSTWTKQAFITAPNPTSGERLGCSVDISTAGDIAIIGANGYGNSINTYTSGATYIFTESGGGWTMRSKILPSNAYAVGTEPFYSQNKLPDAGTWSAFTAYGTNIYASSYGGDIYKQTNGVGVFAKLNQVSRQWRAMCSVGNYIYACVLGGSIYRRANETGDFVSLNQTSRNWIGMAAVGNNVYACVSGGDIYKQTNMAGNFVALGKQTRQWNAMCTDGTYIYLTVTNGYIYKLDPTTDEVTAFESVNKPWYGIVAVGQHLYAYSNYDDIYVRKQGQSSFTATGYWATAQSQPGSVLCLGVLGTSLYLAINSSGGIYKKTGGDSQFGYSVSINGAGTRAISSLPFQNKDTHNAVGEIRILE